MILLGKFSELRFWLISWMCSQVVGWLGRWLTWDGFICQAVDLLLAEVSGGWTTCISPNKLVWASSYGAGILGTETASPFQASACITFVSVLLVWVSHMAPPKARGREKINSTCKNTCKVLLPFLQFTTVIKLVHIKHLDERKWMLSYYSRCIFLSNIISPRWICYVKKQNKYTTATAKRYPVGGRRNSPLLAGRGYGRCRDRRVTPGRVGTYQVACEDKTWQRIENDDEGIADWPCDWWKALQAQTDEWRGPWMEGKSCLQWKE